MLATSALLSASVHARDGSSSDGDAIRSIDVAAEAGGISCISPTLRLKRGEKLSQACRAQPAKKTPYTCDGGAKLCCQVTGKRNMDSARVGRFGQCHRMLVPQNCVPDGVVVRVDLYPDPQDQTSASTATDRLVGLCCSGKCGQESCISGAWPVGGGKTEYSGSCECTCGTEGESKPIAGGAKTVMSQT